MIASLNGLTVLVGGDAARGGSELRSQDEIRLPDRSYRVVVQKGRSFQRANPHIPVAVDRGRYLVVEYSEGTEFHEEPGCFALAPEDLLVSFRVERPSAGVRRDEVGQVLRTLTADSLREMVHALSALHTRHSQLPRLEPALSLVTEWLSAANCAVRREEVALRTGTTANVIGERQGTGDDRRLFIICAHLDSVNHDDAPDGPAPGADDNATGSATVVAIARAVAGIDLQHDVRFILFGGEEQGLFGSKAYVAALSDEDRARIAGVVNIDMAGSLNTDEPSVLLEGAEVSRAVVGRLAQAAATYTTLNTQVSYQPFASDHVPFINDGLPAVLTIEGADSAYAHEHTVRDTPDRLNYDLHREISAMNLAWLLEENLPASG